MSVVNISNTSVNYRRPRAAPLTLIPQPKQPIGSQLGDLTVTRQSVLEFYHKKQLHDALYPGERALTSSGNFRASEMSKCTRAYTYRKLKVAESNPRFVVCPIHGEPDDYLYVFVNYNAKRTNLSHHPELAACKMCKDAMQTRSNLLSAAYGDAIHEVVQARLLELGLVYNWPLDNGANASLASPNTGELSGLELTLDEQVLASDMVSRFLVELKMSMRVDALIKAPASDKNGFKPLYKFLVGEIKTIAHHKRIRASDYIHKQVEYESQLQTYMTATKAPYGWLFVVDRGTQPLPPVGGQVTFSSKDYDEFIVTRNIEMLNGELEYVRRAVALAAKGELDNPQPNMGGCQWCSWRDTCSRETSIIFNS